MADGTNDPANQGGKDPALDNNGKQPDGKGPDGKTLGTGGGDGKEGVSASDFPADWRVKMAGGDAKELARLERLATPTDLYKSYRELENKYNTAKFKPELPKDATPEQLTEFRKQIGVPESADKYDTNLGEGIVIGELDKPVVDGYLAYAHEKNIPNDIVKENLQWYFGEYQKGEALKQEVDKDYQVESEDSLRKDWGADFKQNINLVKGLVEQLGEESADQLMSGRTADGRVIGDDPRMLKLLANWARELNPVHTIVPNSGLNAPQQIETEMAALTKMMGDTRSEYWVGPSAAKNQERYRQLAEAQERLKGKAA